MQSLRLAAAALTVASTLFGQLDPGAVLERATARIRALTSRLDRYVCVETVNRTYYTPTRRGASSSPVCAGPVSTSQYEVVSTDRLRLEVTLSQSRELHSWPGATGFDTRDVDQLIGNGPVSTGSFALYVSTIFRSPGVSFHFEREEVEQGNRRLRYSYRAPVEASRFVLRSGSVSLPVGFEGEFWIDPATLHLERLTVRASEVPAELPLCDVAGALDFRVLPIGDGEVMLPGRSELEIGYRDGRASRNETTFADCREYQAQSEISFDAPDPSQPRPTESVRRSRIALPLGLPVTLKLREPIDSGSAATGDAISATVVKPLRRPGDNTELLPAGAVVHGRIRRIEHHFLPEPYFLIAIAFNRVEAGGSLSPFAARHEADPALVRELGVDVNVRATGIWFWNVGVFLFRTGKPRLTIPAGFESTWFTLAIDAPQR